MYYFAYGSNMLRERLEKRVDGVIDLGIGKLTGYKVVFNKKSKDGSGKANIYQDDRFSVLGVIYELSQSQLETLDIRELGYARHQIEAESDNGIIKAETYVAIPSEIDDNLKPTEDYLMFLIKGAKEHNLPSEYIDSLSSF
ncbi:MAG: hypothetical protein A2593_02440 [Candidatus Moranbacteria bacterium RIFOXYD1_FULL_44_9]|nr:MAG: hypothetical protein A2593_02440 [Candidatus Moranbacteria bacterium RIFOXYD1_FULL_44_9]